jgi:hypothetical protein
MEVHQACVGFIASQLNKYFNARGAGGEVNVLCLDGKVYDMNTLLWYAYLQLVGQARVSHGHFKHVPVFLTGKGTFTAGRQPVNYLNRKCCAEPDRGSYSRSQKVLQELTII